MRFARRPKNDKPGIEMALRILETDACIVEVAVDPDDAMIAVRGNDGHWRRYADRGSSGWVPFVGNDCIVVQEKWKLVNRGVVPEPQSVGLPEADQ